MQFPLTFWDMSLWLAVIAIILLATSELLSHDSGQTSLLVDKKKLKNVAIGTAILFLCTVAVRIYAILFQS